MRGTIVIQDVPRIEISSEVLDVWLSYRQLDPDTNEACGVLIGGFDTTNKCYFFEKVTQPMLKDKRSRTFFKLEDKGHQLVVNDEFNQSNGKSVYLGTWHTHPQRVPVPSEVDYQDWDACIKRNKGRQLFFVIVGTELVKIYAEYGNDFIEISTISSAEC